MPVGNTLHIAIVVHAAGHPDSDFEGLEPVPAPFDRYVTEDLPEP